MLTRKNILSNHLNINQARDKKPMQVCTASLQKHLLPLDEQKYEKIKTNWRQIIPILEYPCTFYKSSKDMFQMSEKIAFLSKKLSNSKEFDLTVINPILSRKS